MTSKKLIKKLAQKNQKEMNHGKDCNGSFGVLEAWYKDINQLDPKSRNTEKFDHYYDNITGMIWGLRAAFFITDEEKDQLTEELVQIFNRFYSTEEN